MNKEDSILYLDRKGMEEYERQTEVLKENLDKIIAQMASAYSSSVGDGWHDNFDFEETVRQELMARRRLNDHIAGRRRIRLIEAQNDIDTDIVDLDDILTLTLVFGENDMETGVYKLVGEVGYTETEKYQSISLNSPLGRSIYGKKIGDITSYQVKGSNILVNIEQKLSEKDLDLRSLK